jgi:hypothetical protein
MDSRGLLRVLGIREFQDDLEGGFSKLAFAVFFILAELGGPHFLCR